MGSRTNTLFVIIDQLRADCLFGALGQHAHLPNLRALMSDGVSFANHYSVCAPCGPSRASILTGQYAMNHRAVRNGTPLRHDTPNLATELRRAGHDPMLFGYTDSAQDPRALAPSDPRLHSYEEVMPGFREVVRQRQEDDIGPWRAYLVAHGYKVPAFPALYRPDVAQPDLQDLTGPDLCAPALYAAKDSDTAFLTDRLLEDLAARPRGWFAHITYIRPHPPFVAPAPYNQMYDPAAMPAALSDTYEHPHKAATRRARPISGVVEGFGDLQPTPENIARIRAVYLGLATEVDHHIGRIVAYLNHSQQFEDTLIVITSDHGEMLGDYGLWGKQTYHDAAFHTPLIIRDPVNRTTAGSVITTPTESVDVTPTMLDLLNVDVPHSMDGRSLRPFVQGTPPQDWRTHTFSELDYGNPIQPSSWQRALGIGHDQANLSVVRTDRYRLVQFASDLAPILFDMTQAGEAQNIAADPTAFGPLLDMTQRMLQHRMRHPEGTFAHTLIGPNGPETAALAR
jgi:arylsulfatase A-like enzyme